VSYKDRKSFIADLKPVYKAATEQSALSALDEFESKWSSKYMLGVKSWRDNWNEISTMSNTRLKSENSFIRPTQLRTTTVNCAKQQRQKVH